MTDRDRVLLGLGAGLTAANLVLVPMLALLGAWPWGNVALLVAGLGCLVALWRRRR